jgi:hypothetical protein
MFIKLKLVGMITIRRRRVKNGCREIYLSAQHFVWRPRHTRSQIYACCGQKLLASTGVFRTPLRHAASPQLLRGHAISLSQSALQVAKPLVESYPTQGVFLGAETA